MTTPSSGQNDNPQNTDELREQIDRTRDELADTVQALAHKADVKSRARETVADAKLKLVDLREQAKVTAARDSEVARHKLRTTSAQRPWLIPSALAGVVTLITSSTWLLIRRRRR